MNRCHPLGAALSALLLLQLFMAAVTANGVQFPAYTVSAPVAAPSLQAVDVTMGNSFANGFTLEAWVNVPSTVPSGELWVLMARNSISGGTGINFGVGQPTGATGPRISCGVNAAGSGFRIASGATDLTPNQWTHIACTYDGKVTTAFFNGVADGSSAATAVGQAPVLSATLPWTIGSEDTVLGRHFSGAVDQVRIWNVPRSAAQITSDMNTGHMSVPATNLLSDLSFRATDMGGASGVDGVAALDRALASTLWYSAWQWTTGNTEAAVAVRLVTDSTSPAPCTYPSSANPTGCQPVLGSSNCYCSVRNNFGPNAVQTSASILGGQYLGHSNAALGSNLAAFTMEAWFQYSTVQSQDVGLVSKNMDYNTPPVGVWLGLTGNGQLTCQVQTNSGLRVVTTASTTPLNVYQHAACTYDGKTLVLYLQGVMVKSLTNALAAALIPATDGWVIGGFGSAQGSTGNAFVGQIDNVRIWSVARTAAQILNTYSRRLSGQNGGLLSYVTFRPNGNGFEIVENKWPNPTLGWTIIGPSPSLAFLTPDAGACLDAACGSAKGPTANGCLTNDANGGCGLMQCNSPTASPSEPSAARFCDQWKLVGSYIGADSDVPPSICVIRGNYNVFFLAQSPAVNTIKRRESLDGGATWTEYTLSGVAFSFTPECVVTDNGVVHLFGMGVGSAANVLQHYKSNDAAATFSNAPLGVSVNCAAPAQGYVDGDGLTVIVQCPTVPFNGITVIIVPPVGAVIAQASAQATGYSTSGSYMRSNDRYESYFKSVSTVQLVHAFDSTPMLELTNTPSETLSGGAAYASYRELNHVLVKDASGTAVFNWRSNGIDSTYDGLDLDVLWGGTNRVLCDFEIDITCAASSCMGTCRRYSESGIWVMIQTL